MIKTKRAQQGRSKQDGLRILVERLWPRGVKKEDAAVDLWLKSLAPSPELRKWFGHDPEKWDEFRRRYRKELDRHADLLALLKHRSTEGNVTLVYGSSDREHNSSVALKERIEQQDVRH